MTALLWKDYRINRLVLLTGVVLLVAPYVAFCGLNFACLWRYDAVYIPWTSALTQAGMLSMVLSLVTITLLGGNAFANERATRAAEFLAYLPPTRVQQIVSKIIVAVGAGALIWAVEVLVFFVIVPRSGPMAPDTAANLAEFRGRILPVLTAFAIGLFGAAWCGSSLLPSHNIAAGLAFGFPILVFGLLRAIEFAIEEYEFAVRWFPLTCTVLGILGLIAGVVIHARRIEP